MARESANNHDTQRLVQSLAFLGVLVGTLALTYFIFRPYLANVVLSAILAVLFRPLFRRLSKLFGGHETLAAVTVSIIALLALAVPLAIFIVVLSGEIVGTYRFISGYDLSGLLDRFQYWIQDIFGVNAQISSIDFSEYIRSVFAFLVKNILGIFSNIADFIVQILIFVLTLFYLLRDGTKFRHFLVRLSPMADVYDEEVLKRLSTAVKSIIGGNIIIAIIQGIIAMVGFSIFGVPDPVIWGSLAALASLIPAVGTSLITIPAIIYLALGGMAGGAVGLAIWAAAVVGLVDNFLAPKLIGRGIKINPLLVMLSVFGGLVFFGPLGFLFGPLVLSLLFALLGIYEKEFKDYVSFK